MADPQPSPTERPLSQRFLDNANLAFGINTFTEVLLAMSAKLLELGVPGAKTVEEADRIDDPLREAMFEAENIEAYNAARRQIFLRVLQLGRLLPPEEADGDFRVDRVQVRHLLRRWHEAAPSGLAEKFQEHAELGDWYYDTGPNKMKHLLAVGHWQAERRFGDLLEGGLFDGSVEGLAESRALIWSFYTGSDPSEYQSHSVKSQVASPEAEAPDTTSAVASQKSLDARQPEKQDQKHQSSGTREVSAQPVASQTEAFHSPDGVTENADIDTLRQHSIRPILGQPKDLIKKARMLAQRVENLRAEDIIDLSDYRRDKGLGDDPDDLILRGSNRKMPVVRVNGSFRWWIPNLVYSRLSRLMNLSVLNYSVATHAPAEVKADGFVVVCSYFRGWIPLEEWQEIPRDERVEITNSGPFDMHVALELLVDTVVDDATFGYILPNGNSLRNPSRHSFGPFYIGLAMNGQDEQWRGMYHGEVDAPPRQLRWNDYLKSINEYNVSPSAVAVLLKSLAALTDDDLVSCVRLPDFPHRERVQSVLLSRLLRIRKTAHNYRNKVDELANKVEELANKVEED